MKLRIWSSDCLFIGIKGNSRGAAAELDRYWLLENCIYQQGHGDHRGEMQRFRGGKVATVRFCRNAHRHTCATRVHSRRNAGNHFVRGHRPSALKISARSEIKTKNLSKSETARQRMQGTRTNIFIAYIKIPYIREFDCAKIYITSVNY